LYDGITWSPVDFSQSWLYVFGIGMLGGAVPELNQTKLA